jgi:hypothetical protein
MYFLKLDSKSFLFTITTNASNTYATTSSYILIFEFPIIFKHTANIFNYSIKFGVSD